MQPTDSIWIQDSPSNLDDTRKRIKNLWPEESNPGAGGQILRLKGVSPKFSTSRLQQFASALIGELRYQTCEIFCSPPTHESKPQNSPAIVAGAYRKSDATHGQHDQALYRIASPRGTYTLSQSDLKPLRRLLLSGESVGNILDRMKSYENGIDPELCSFINYTLAGTVIAMLADLGPSIQEGPGPILWEIVKQAIQHNPPKGTKGIESAATRAAIRYIVQANEDLLLELDTDIAFLKGRASISAKSMSSDMVINDEDIDVAIELLVKISAGLDKIASTLRTNLWTLPSSVIRLLFEAPTRSYPIWLQSATLTVERKGYPILHGDLRALIRSREKYRNKRVNLLTLSAYEDAASWLLLSDDETKDNKPVLKSMLLFPFTVLGPLGLQSNCFIRFMNRFHKISSDECHLYIYKDKCGIWTESEEEKYLGLALTGILRDNLPELGLLSENKTYSAMQPYQPEKITNLPRQDAAIIATEIYPNFIGHSSAMETVFGQIRDFAESGISVLIRGNNGTGKELVARAIHHNSKQSKGLFIPINCASIPGGLFESELFGYVAGAFAGAMRGGKAGLIEKAHKGTLFLDEIVEFPIILQAKLLRVLQDHIVERLGSTEPKHIAFRLIAATNQDIENYILEGRFREDLYWLLSRICG